MGAMPTLNAATMTADKRSAVTMTIPSAFDASTGVGEPISIRASHD